MKFSGPTATGNAGPRDGEMRARRGRAAPQGTTEALACLQGSSREVVVLEKEEALPLRSTPAHVN